MHTQILTQKIPHKEHISYPKGNTGVNRQLEIGIVKSKQTIWQLQSKMEHVRFKIPTLCRTPHLKMPALHGSSTTSPLSILFPNSFPKVCQ